MKIFRKNFVRYIDAGLPILYVDTFEGYKTKEIIRELCSQHRRDVIEWNLLGAVDFSDGQTLALPKSDLAATLQLLIDDDNLDNKTLILQDAHFSLDKPETIAALKAVAQGITSGKYDCTVCIISPLVPLPKELENYTTIMELDPLTEENIGEIVRGFIKTQEIDQPEDDLLNKIITRLKGLSQTEIYNILSLAISEDGMLTSRDLTNILEQKQQLVKKSGILEMIRVKETMNDIGGLENLKRWLLRKSEIFKQIKKAQDFGVDIPKGVLIAGMPGCGKSLTAKAAAKSFDVPLLRLDMGRLMGKYVGESEGNMRRAIKITEASSPCVLWIDELEKAFAGVGGKGGGSEVTTRLFGNFLTWMQEKDSLAFVVATANKIDALPPELLRKGRFDETFYVDLPNRTERRKILEIHIRKRRPRDLSRIDLDRLADKTDGYCGADLEGVVREAIESAFVQKKPALTTDEIIDAIENTHSLSEVMKDSIDDMKKTYETLKLKSASK
ncbi:MAG: AAA family ATPase [Quinella sp. 2Q5]|nr:AAA family ATPase [Quinella sp. 2Q5]